MTGVVMPPPARAHRAGSRPVDRSSSHRAAGIGRRSSSAYSSRCGGRADAGDQPRDRGMGQRELHRRRLDRHAVALARVPQRLRARHDLGWRLRVVERGAGSRIRQDAAVHHAAHHHGHAALDARRQQVGERILVEQRVPAGEQDRVDVGLAHEPARASPTGSSRRRSRPGRPPRAARGGPGTRRRSRPASARRGRGCRRCRSGPARAARGSPRASGGRRRPCSRRPRAAPPCRRRRRPRDRRKPGGRRPRRPSAGPSGPRACRPSSRGRTSARGRPASAAPIRRSAAP